MLIDDAGPKIEGDDIAVFETTLRATLPADYREFLLLYNGGIPTPDTIDIPGVPGTPTDVQVFFGLERSVESSDLSWNLALVRERCPEIFVLPIACDSGENLFCLSVERGVATKVIYCDLDSSDCALYEVASNFEEFLTKLRPFDQ